MMFYKSFLVTISAFATLFLVNLSHASETLIVDQNYPGIKFVERQGYVLNGDLVHSGDVYLDFARNPLWVMGNVEIGGDLRVEGEVHFKFTSLYVGMGGVNVGGDIHLWTLQSRRDIKAGGSIMTMDTLWAVVGDIEAESIDSAGSVLAYGQVKTRGDLSGYTIRTNLFGIHAGGLLYGHNVESGSHIEANDIWVKYAMQADGRIKSQNSIATGELGQSIAAGLNIDCKKKLNAPMISAGTNIGWRSGSYNPEEHQKISCSEFEGSIVHGNWVPFE